MCIVAIFLAALAAVRLGAEFVYATDGASRTVELANYNVRSNLLLAASGGAGNEPASFRAEVLKWGDAVDIAKAMAATSGRGFDLVLGADLLYLPYAYLCTSEHLNTSVSSHSAHLSVQTELSW